MYITIKRNNSGLPMKPARYQNQVRMCAAEIRAALPALTSRHTPLVVIAALTEHMRGALFLTQEARVCAPEKAKAIIRRMEEIAFKQDPASPAPTPTSP
jgi:hypothetical protein